MYCVYSVATGRGGTTNSVTIGTLHQTLLQRSSEEQSRRDMGPVRYWYKILVSGLVVQADVINGTGIATAQRIH